MSDKQKKLDIDSYSVDCGKPQKEAAKRYGEISNYTQGAKED